MTLINKVDLRGGSTDSSVAQPDPRFSHVGDIGECERAGKQEAFMFLIRSLLANCDEGGLYWIIIYITYTYMQRAR